MCLRLCSKLTYSFVAIELLDFSKNAKIPFLILKRALGIWALKIYTPYVKRIGFFYFCLYKNVSQKKRSLYINKNSHDCHQRKTTCTFLYTVWMKTLTIFSGDLILLHHYKGCFAHLLAFQNLVIDI